MLNILDPRHPERISQQISLSASGQSADLLIQRQPTIGRDLLDTQLNSLDVLATDANTPHATQMPARLALEVLHHDPSQYDELRLDGSDDRMVGQVKPVRDLAGHPLEVPVRVERAGLLVEVLDEVLPVYLGEPFVPALDVLGPRFPMFPVEAS